MGKIISVVFIQGDKWYSKIIRFVESLFTRNRDRFIPSHCGMIVDNHFREALSSGFVETNIDAYDKSKIRIYDLVVTDLDKIKNGDAAFSKVWGREYGWLALVNGLLYTATGVKTDGDGEFSGDCSEDDTRILRAYGFDILNDVPADDITPYILMQEVEKIGKLRN
jgi:hypothetical protein